MIQKGCHFDSGTPSITIRKAQKFKEIDMFQEMMVSESGGGISNYAEGDISITNTDTTTIIPLQFTPKCIIATGNATSSGVSYTGMYIYDEKTSTNKIMYRTSSNLTADFGQIPSTQPFTIVTNGFNLHSDNTAWNGKVHYVAIG